MERDDGRQVGERLRTIRRQERLSLLDVEARSDHEFKASVLGAYERGDRVISVPRLLQLAALYRVPPDQLLPKIAPTPEIDPTESLGDSNDEFTIDLDRLHRLADDDTAVIARYAATIQLQRQDFDQRMLTIRGDDLRVLAAVMGRSREDLGQRMKELGLLDHVDARLKQTDDVSAQSATKPPRREEEVHHFEFVRLEQSRRH